MGRYPFATLKITINNICCDDMQFAFKEGRLAYDFESRCFRLNHEHIWECPYCGRLLHIHLEWGKDIMVF